MSPARIHVGHRSQANVLQLVGHDPGAAGALDRLLVRAEQEQTVHFEGQRTSEPSSVTEMIRERLRPPEVFEGPLVLPEQRERVPEVEKHLHGLRLRGGGIGQALQDLQRLLEPGGGLAVGGMSERLRARLAEIACRSIPALTTAGMMGESLDVLAQPVGIEMLDGVHDPGMERGARLSQQRVVGNLASQAVPEDVLGLWKQGDVVDEFSRSEATEAVTQLILRHVGNRVEQADGHVLSDHRRALQEPLVSGREAVDPRRQDRLDRGRHQDRRHGLAQTIAPALPDENTVLGQRPDAFLEKEGVPLGAIDQYLLESGEISVSADEGGEKLLRASWRQRIDTELAVASLAPPVVPVFRSVIDEEENPRGRQAVDQAVEERLGLGVDPVQILEEKTYRPHLTLSQQEVGDRVHRLLPPLAGSQRTPLRVVVP